MLQLEKYLLSSRQLNNFRADVELQNEADIKAAKGAYFIEINMNLNGEDSKNWLLIAEINQDLASVAKIQNLLKTKNDIKQIIEDDVELGTRKFSKNCWYS